MLLDTPVCEFGKKAPDFTLSEPNGESYSFKEHMGENGLLIMFICNHCPYVQKIVKQLAQDSKVLISEGINVLAIMSNDYKDYPEDSPEKMVLFKKQNNFEFPYLLDKDQSVGKAYGAVCTPDFFGFNNKSELQYRGRIDELLSAMRMIAKTGKGPTEQVPSMGCSIKWAH